MVKRNFKPKLNILFAILGTLILIPNVSADFSVGDEKLNKINVTNGTYSLTFDYNDGNITNNYVFYSDDTKLTIKEIDLPKTKSNNNDNHKFVGWYSEKVGGSKITFPYTVNFSKNENENLRVYARYSNNNPYSTGGNLTASTNTYYIGSESNTITLSSNQNINLYYSSSSSGVYNKDNYGTLNVVPKISNAKTKAVLNSDIVLNGGTIQLNSVLGYKSGNGGDGGYLNGSISSNDYTALDLNGYTITVNSGSINGYGIIYNSKDEGGIVMNGGTLISPFLINDFKGGGNTVFGYVNTVTPFYMYCMPFLGCEIVFSNKSSLKGEASLNASDDKYTTTIPLIGNSSSGSLISINSGYVIKRTTSFDRYSEFYPTASNAGFTTLSKLINSESLYREEVLLVDNPSTYVNNLLSKHLSGVATNSGNISIKSIEMEISVGVTATISMALADFSIPPWMDLNIYNSAISFTSSFIALPGSKLFIDEKSVVTFGSEKKNNINGFARFTLLDEFPKDFAHINTDGTTQSLVSGEPYVDKVSKYAAKPAFCEIYGDFRFNSISNPDSVNCYSMGGYFNHLSEKAINSLKLNSSTIDLSTRFYYPHWSSSVYKMPVIGKVFTAYCPSPARYYSLPVIYNENSSCKALFQITSLSSIYVGNYNFDNHTVVYSGTYYFRLFENQFSASLYNQSEAFTKTSPTQDNYNYKMNNSNGKFVNLSSANEVFGIAYIVYNNTKYIYVAGAYIPVTGEISAKKKNNNIVIGTTYAKPTEGIFTPIKANNLSKYNLCATNLEYNYTIKEWVFVNA